MPLRYSHHASLPWPFTGGGSGRVSRPSGRRRSPCDQCGSIAATEPRRGAVVVRRRAGRRQWTASWALAGEPRSRRGESPAAAVRGADRLLAHTACVSTWLPLTAVLVGLFVDCLCLLRVEVDLSTRAGSTGGTAYRLSSPRCHQTTAIAPRLGLLLDSAWQPRIHHVRGF